MESQRLGKLQDGSGWGREQSEDRQAAGGRQWWWLLYQPVLRPLPGAGALLELEFQPPAL